ncbi:MAG: hypothetical protein GC161_04665 [Planctomycetaceae bacterium]|nr:hypothetical protein [Planctomycetaceae bacterium]
MDVAAHTLTTGGPPRVGDFELELRDLGLLLGFAAATLLADRVLLTMEGREVHGQGGALEEAGETRRIARDNPLHPAGGQWQLDPECGYVPTPGNPDYGAHGALANDYPLDRTPGVGRVLFVGDSATRRGRVLEGLGPAAAARRVELWNAGVDAFGTAQTAAYLDRVLPKVRPDAVVLTFHLNDFETTPIVFLDDKGDLVQFFPGNPRYLSPFLLANSGLYRHWVRRTAEAPDPAYLDQEIEAALQRMKRACEALGARFVVAILPLMASPGQYDEGIERHAEALHLRAQMRIRAAGIDPCDWRPAVAQAVALGENVQAVPGDVMHPHPEVAARLAQALLDCGLFDGL